MLVKYSCKKLCKSMSILVSLLLLFVTIMPAASAAAAGESRVTASFNEYDMIKTLRTVSNEILEEEGYSQDEIIEIKGNSFEARILERASLPADNLSRLGYTSDQIRILKEVDITGQVNLSDDQLRAITGTCTGWISPVTASKSEYRISYEWEWDHAPIICYKDSFAVRWEAIGTNGLPVDSTAGYLTSGYVNYYDDSGYYIGVEKISPSKENIGFNVVQFNFNVGSGTATDPVYAMSGSANVQIQKDQGITRDFYYLKVSGLYGHTVANIGAPSVSVSDGGISLSFSGGIKTDNIAGDKCKIDLNNKRTTISG